MKSLFAIVLAAALLLSGCAIENQYERAQRSCVAVDSPGLRGSGFLIWRVDPSNHARALVWTAAHVVRGIDSADIIYTARHNGHRTGKKTFHARVIARDSEDDLALLVIDAAPFSFWPARFDFDSEPVGAQVFDVGNVRELDASVLFGIVSQKDAQPPGNLWKRIDQTSAPVYPGFSGGAVYDNTTGNVIGIVVGRISDSCFGFYVPVREISSFAKKYGVQFALDGLACPDAARIDALAQLAKVPLCLDTTPIVIESLPVTSSPLSPKQPPKKWLPKWKQ